MLKDYYKLAKPGIIYGNALPAIAGFFLASGRHFNFWLFLAMLGGLCLIVGSACVFNNIYDRTIDAKMERTKTRALPGGRISVIAAAVFGVILLLLGLGVLYSFTNIVCLLTALLGFVLYVFVYTPFKSKTVYATLIGSLPGATPPVVGYTAVLGKFDLAALLLFVILILWQMPHFYAIAIRRLKEYENAGVPVFPAVKGIKRTKKEIVGYIIAFIICALLLTFFGYTKYFYAAAVLLLGMWWLKSAWAGFKTLDQSLWAKKVFLFSLWALLGFCLVLSLAPILP